MVRKLSVVVALPLALNGLAIIAAVAGERWSGSAADTRLDVGLQVLLGCTLLAPILGATCLWWADAKSSQLRGDNVCVCDTQKQSGAGGV